ncbi:MAG: CapA family protein [Mesorhizobium sp.]|uniref:CapA family protein n=1 Tax=Mesorhizobium sp. TaxID=1871066 RepID=UPI000FE378B2|nr:CapA family protein [Mesorhizobium sp.]RWJ04390.1 MAG: CapA family protein [Mesorhizobium sp.]RWJ15153.1 MAG: CapA family protein [Mesorhizobium sp.]
MKHMKHRLPDTYIDILKPPSVRYWLKMNAVYCAARLIGFWDKPRPQVTEDSEEYTFINEAYANYKYLKPITRPEQTVYDTLFASDRSIVKLPPDFETTASLTMGAAGDLMPAEGLEASKDILFENVADVLLNVDISFANLEAPVTEQKIEVKFTGGDAAPIMGFSPSEFAAVAGHKGLNFNLLSFANNHAFDWGVEGLNTTSKLLAQHGIVPIGTPRTPLDYGRATIIHKQGITIGFVSTTDSLNGPKPPPDAAHRIHVAKLSSTSPNLELLKRQIVDAKTQGCDFIVASLHWGCEAEFFPRKHQIDIAHTLVEAGVDLLLGHHPHVIQPVEYYRTKRDQRRIAVIAYSLGGLGYRWYTAPHFALGLILNLKIEKGKTDVGERTYIACVNPVPVFQNIFVSYFGDMRIKRLEMLTNHLEGGGESSSLGSYASEVKRYADLVLPE